MNDAIHHFSLKIRPVRASAFHFYVKHGSRPYVHQCIEKKISSYQGYKHAAALTQKSSEANFTASGEGIKVITVLESLMLESNKILYEMASSTE